MEEARNGVKLIAPKRQESMHFETALTLSRKAVKLHRQAGQTHTGTDNSTPGDTRPRWRIEIRTLDKVTPGPTCPLISKVGFASKIQHQPNNSLEEAPLSSSMDLEDVIFARRLTVRKATSQLESTATVTTQGKPNLLQLNQAFANLSEGQWNEFTIQGNQIPTTLIDTCYEQIITQEDKDTYDRPIVIFCDKRLTTTSKLESHLRISHGIELHALPQAILRPPAQLPQAFPSDRTAEVITKLDIVLTIATSGSEQPANHKSPQEWKPMKEHIKQFFEHTPTLFTQYMDKFGDTKQRTNISWWLSKAWERFTHSHQAQHDIATFRLTPPPEGTTDSPTPREMQRLQPTQTRTIQKATSNVSQASQSADTRTTDTGNAPFKENGSDDLLGHAEPRTPKTPQDETTYSEKQSKETIQQVTNTCTYNCKGTAEQNTDPDATLKQTLNQEGMLTLQPSTEDRTPQSTTGHQHLPATKFPSTRTPALDGTTYQSAGTSRTNKIAKDEERQRKYGTVTADHWALINSQQGTFRQDNVHTEPAGNGMDTTPKRATEIEVNISVKTDAGNMSQQYKHTMGQKPPPSTNSTESTSPSTNLEIRVTDPAATDNVTNQNPNKTNPDTSKYTETPEQTGDTSTTRNTTGTRDTDSRNTDWYSIMLEDEINEDIRPQDTQTHRLIQAAEPQQQSRIDQERPRLSIRTLIKDEQFSRAELSDTMETVIRKLEHITLTLQQKLNLVDGHGYVIPEAESQIRPLIHNFLLRKRETKTTLTLIIALCHKPNWRIPLHKLTNWAAAAWGMTSPRNKKGMSTQEYATYFKEVLESMVKRNDTRSQAMNKFRRLSQNLCQINPTFSSDSPHYERRELTYTEWGWMHALLEAFMLRINGGKGELAGAIYQITGINIDQFAKSKTISSGDLARGIVELWETNEYTTKNRPSTQPTNQPQQCGMSSRTCVLEIALVGTTITIQHPTRNNHTKYQHITLPDEPNHHNDHLTPQPTEQARLISNEPTSVSEHPTRKPSETEKQATSQHKQGRTILHPGIVYNIGRTTYKFNQPQNQKFITMNNQRYLTIGTTQTKGTRNRYKILVTQEISPENSMNETTGTTLDLPRGNNKLHSEHDRETPSKNDINPGHIYRIAIWPNKHSATIRLDMKNHPADEHPGCLSIGTAQTHKIRSKVLMAMTPDERAHPHPSLAIFNKIPDTNQEPGHHQGNSLMFNPTHTRSQPHGRHLSYNGHLEQRHLDLTHNPHDGIDSFEKHQPNKEDTAQQHTELHPGLAQQPEEEKMGPRPDAADAGNFLRRQIKSPGNFSRSNRKAFLKFEEEMDHKLIYSTIIPRRLKKKAPSKTSITATMIRNSLLLNEDMQAGQCSRYQCRKPRTCFLARKSKQETGSLYDSWKCYKPPAQ